MNKEYVKKMGLTEQIKRLRAIQEYTFITKPSLDEDDDEPQDGGMNPTMGGEEAPVPGPEGGDMGGGMPAGPVDGVGTDLPQNDGGENQGGDMPGGEPMQDGDEVIDVDQLTNTQQETDLKVDTVSAKVITTVHNRNES